MTQIVDTASEYMRAMLQDLESVLKKADAPAWVRVMVNEVSCKHIVAVRDEEWAEKQRRMAGTVADLHAEREAR